MRLQDMYESRNMSSTDIEMYNQFKKLADTNNGMFLSDNQASKMKSVLDSNNQFSLFTTIRKTTELPVRTKFIVTCDNNGVIMIAKSVDSHGDSVIWERK